jgi:hypothetical protein
MNFTMTQPAFTLDLWRSSTNFIRLVGTLIITCYLFVFYSPSVMAITHTTHRVEFNANEQLMNKLQQVHTETRQYLKYRLDKKQRQQAFIIYQTHIKALALELGTQRDASEQHIKQNLKAAKDNENVQELALNTQLLSALVKEYEVINANINAIIQAKYSPTHPVILAAITLDKKLSTLKFGKMHHEYDSESMPFGPSSSAVYKPAKNSEQLKERLLIKQKKNTNKKSLKSRVSVRNSATTPAALPTEAENLSDYLNFNVDNQSTTNLIDLAASLNHDAVNIYQYIYNKVEYIPAHGSIQGADYTAQSLRGGAMDQASLLIALLRLSNIPARYVYGSIKVDIEQAMNWVGGVTEPNAAQNILSQGGVPNTLIINQQGEVINMNVEHVWVEAHQNGQWTAIDPSFKQYQYTEAIDLSNAIELDEQTIVDNITSGATINENEGWVQNINQSAIDTELTGIQTQIEDYINNKYPNATVQDIIGSKEIIATRAIQLPSKLPYVEVITSEPLIDLPDNLRHKFGFELKNKFGSSALTFERSLPELAGKRLAVSFSPATEADEQKIIDLLPEEIERVEQLPNELPYGAFKVTANIMLNEKIVQSSTANYAFGQELTGHKGFWSPRFNWEKKSSVLIAGEYQAIGIDTHGMSAQALAGVKTVLEATKVNIEAETFESLTSHNTTGAIMQAGIHSYLVVTKVQNILAASAAKVISYRQPSYGTFGTNLNVSYYFGIPSKVIFSGVAMDVDKLVNNSESKTNCWDIWSDYNRRSGAMASYLENLIPEQLFSTEDKQLDGISAVKALAIANQQGQKIYTLTTANANLLTEVTIDSTSRQEIQNALNAGKEVTVHELPINEFGWTGSGYVIIDPDTGAGGYKLNGGGNGGSLTTALGGLSGYLDGLSRFKDNWFNGGNSALYGKISGVLTLISAVYSVVDTVTNSSLSVSDKITNIVINMSSAIAMIGISQAVMANVFLAASNPFLLGVFLAVIAVTISLIVMDIMLEISMVNPNKNKNKVYV